MDYLQGRDVEFGRFKLSQNLALLASVGATYLTDVLAYMEPLSYEKAAAGSFWFMFIL
jgi:hypothetical protein